MEKEPRRSLVVVLGAGASHDCYVKEYSPPPEKHFQPPLTSGLFQRASSFQNILTRYRYAVPAAAEFNRRVAQEGRASVEEYLKELNAEDDPICRRQFLHIGLYLQDLFSTISRTYLGEQMSHLLLSASSIRFIKPT